METPVAKFFLGLLSHWAPIIALILQAFVLSRFLERKSRDYPLAIIYSLVLFVMTSLAILWQEKVQWVLDFVPPGASQLSVYAAAEVGMHLLLLILMLQLIDQTHQLIGVSRLRLWSLAAISGLVSIASVWWYSNLEAQAQFAGIRQAIGFWMVVLNLYWWSLLLRAKRLDRRILLLSAGIGLQMTGQVIGDGMFGFASKVTPPDAVLGLVGATVLFAAHFGSLSAWYEAFHPKNAAKVNVPSFADSSQNSQIAR